MTRIEVIKTEATDTPVRLVFFSESTISTIYLTTAEALHLIAEINATLHNSQTG